ncbi:ABC transporter ATP-binding protein [Palleronia sp. KMU-117]|uniref:ABC transporter ATP-binding protein n=1 Tax=Palleronia sp. KMU-117 TaxID=3434108 RepID=UPI003D75DD01
MPEFRLAAGERLLLLGRSGSGKSTLLGLVSGTIRPGAGQVTLLGRDLASVSGAAMDRLRGESFGIIFQQFNLLPFATGLDNVLLPLGFAPARRSRCPDPAAEALRLLSALGLPEDLMRRAPAARLSVGQQQRVAVARAMIGRPPIILADEPTSALDAAAQGDFLSLLFEQCAATGAALLMVSHDDRLAGRFDRVLDMGAVVRAAA